jgi:hypothetical protein
MKHRVDMVMDRSEVALVRRGERTSFVCGEGNWSEVKRPTIPPQFYVKEG